MTGLETAAWRGIPPPELPPPPTREEAQKILSGFYREIIETRFGNFHITGHRVALRPDYLQRRMALDPMFRKPPEG